MAASTGPSSLVSLRPCEEGGLPSGRAMACRAFFPALSRSRPCLSAETSGPSFSSSAPSWWNGRGPAPKTVAMAFSDPDVYQIPYVEGMPVGKKLKLWNLPPNCPREDLLEWFHAVNVTVDSLEFTDDPVLNAQGIGAFVEFGTKQDACVAIIRLDGYKLKGRSIRMDFVEKRPYSKDYGRRNRNKSWASDAQSHAVPRSNIEVRPSMAGAVAHTSDVEGPKNDSGYGSSQPGAGPSYGTIQANNATSLTNSEAQTFAVNDELHPSHSNRGYGTSHHAEDSSYGSTYSSATGKGYMKSTSDIDVRTIYHDNTDGHSGYNSYPPGPTYGTTSFTDNRERVGNESHGYEQSVPTQGNSIAPNDPMDSAAGLDYAANRSNHHSLPIYGNGINTLQAAPGNAPGYSEAGVRNASSYGNSQPVTGFGNGTQFVPTYSPTRLGNHSQFAQSSHIGPQYGSQQGYDMGSFRASRSNRLFVGNLAWIVDENRLQQLFSQYGTVLEARVIKDRDSGRSRGFGFVSMLTADELQAAIEALDGLELEGRLIKVNVAASRS